MKIKEVACKTCGIKYPETWKTCPICGQPARRRRPWWILVLAAVLVVTVVAAAMLVVVPQNRKKRHYDQAKEYEAQGKYDLAQEEYLSAGNYEDAPELLELARKAEHYQLGQEAFEEGNFVLAEEEFLAAGDYSDAAAQAAVSRQAEQYRLGCEAMDRGDYDAAIAAFEAAGDYSDAAAQAKTAAQARDYNAALECMSRGDYAAARELLIQAGNYENSLQYQEECSYYMAMDAMSRGDYEEALELFNQFTVFNDSAVRKQECATILGKQQLQKKDFENALSYFKEAKDAHVSTDELNNYILLCNAEISLAKGKLSEGIEEFDKIPSTFRPAEYDVYNRRIQLNKYRSFANLEGTWHSSSYDIKITKTGGGWVNSYYYPAGTLDDMKITIRCFLNNDGTVTVKGEANFYYFNTYPAPYGYTDKEKTITFEIPNQTYAPSGYAVDENTKLYLAGKAPRLTYHASVDDGTASAISDVTYNEKQ